VVKWRSIGKNSRMTGISNKKTQADLLLLMLLSDLSIAKSRSVFAYSQLSV